MEGKNKDHKILRLKILMCTKVMETVLRIDLKRGGWLAQPLEHVTLELRVVSLSPILGVELTLNKQKEYIQKG